MQGDGVFTTLSGEVLKTSPALSAMPLLVAPVLPWAQLENVQTLTVSYMDLELSTTARVKRSLQISSVTLVSNTRVIFKAVDDSEVKVWDGVATYHWKSQSTNEARQDEVCPMFAVTHLPTHP